MKDFFNRRQRFSLRKYSFGVASVLLGTALFAAHSVQADEVATPTVSAGNPGTSVAGESSSSLVNTTTTAPQSNPAASVTSPSASATSTSTVALVSPASEVASASTTETTSTAAAPATTATAAATASSTPTAAGTTSVGSAPSSSTGTTSTSAVTPTAVQPTVEQPVASTTQPTATTQPVSTPTATQPVASTQPTSASVAQPATTTLTTSTPSPTSVANTAALTTMLTANPMSAAGTAPEVRSRSSRRRRDAANPVTTNYTTGPATATPAMSDPNGATISSRPLVVPTPKDSGQHVTTGIDFQLNPNPSQYTFAVTDLNSFNATYNKKYYYRLSKPYNASNDITIELVDGQNNNVVETKSINGSGTVSLGQSILAPLTGSSQAYIEFRFENIQDADKSSRPALRATWKVSGLVQNFAGQRSGIQIYDVANKANEGTSITDPQYYIPRLTDKTTYYKAVDRGTRQDVSRTEGIATITTAKRSNDVKNSDIVARYADGTVDVRNENGQIVNKTTYVNVDRNNINPQEYKEDGAEINLGTYTSTGMEGQNLTASGLRAFEGYKLYQTADSRSLIDVLKQPFHVGQRWFDVANAQGGVKRIKEVVSEDGTVRIEMWAIKSDSLNKISSDLNTDGYFKVYETVIPPGKNNYDVRPQDAGKDIDVSDPGWNQDNNTPQIPKPGFEYIDSLKSKLVQGKPFTIFSDKQVTNYKGDLQFEKTENNVTTLLFKRPNGTFYKMDKEYLQDASGNPTGKVNMKETDVSATDANGYKPTYVSKGEFYVNRGDKDNAYSINGTPVSSGNVFRLQNDLNPVYRTVYYYAKPEPVKVKLQFTKALAGRTLQDGEFDFKIQDTASGYNETVSNQNGKVTFSELTFTKPGVYTYKVNEVPGTDTDVDYDGMESTVTITVTEKNAIGDLDAKVTYTSINGQDDSGNTTDTNVSATNPTVRTGTDTEFNNFVVAPVNVEFDFTKKLSGRNLKANEFTFNLLNEAGAVVGTAKNDLNGNIKFTGIKYKVSDLGTNSAGKRNDSKTFNYTVKEVVPTTAEAGMSYDQMEAKVAVTVTKTGHTLTTATTYSSVNGIDANGNPTTGVDKEFNNTFTPNPVKVNLEFDKSLSNGTLNAGDFSFKLTGDGNVNETVTNKANGKINFSTLSFDKAGVYNYTVKEVAGTNTDVDYDAMTINVKVTVTKDANTGLLSASTVMTSSGGEATDANDRVFNNFVVPPVPVNVNFTKALAGRTLVAGEFTFEMKDENGVVVATGTNDEHGVVTFNQLPEVKNAQVGKVIKYKVTEKVPANKEFGVTYDNMVAEVSVTVSKNADHTLKATVTYPGGDTEFNNVVTPPTEPKFQPEKFIVNKKKFDITGNKLMDDDNELTNEYTETNADPYVDKTNNNEPENLNTKTVKKGDEIVYQVWLDTTNLKASDNIQAVGITDKYEADKLKINVADIKAYDSVTGADVTSKFVITVNNGEITATSKNEFIKDKVIDTTKFEFGRYYKFDIPATVKMTTPNGVDIENTANQIVHQYDPTKRDITKPEKPTQKRVVNLPVPLEFDFTKKLDGRNLVENEFTFVLKKDGVEVERAKNGAPDATTGIAKINFTKLEFGKDDIGKTYNYTVEEVKGTDSTVSYDGMVATVRVSISHDGTAKAIVKNVVDAPDKEFDNRVTPPEEPKFNPEKYVVRDEDFDLTGKKLLDDDSELADKYGDTKINPYADKSNNNEKVTVRNDKGELEEVFENLNTQPVKRGQKFYYQVWLDTTQFSANNKENIQTVGITDNYDESKLIVTKNTIKVYDGETGADVTSKFDVAVTNGIITANLKSGFTKSLGDANNTQVIDTTKFEFGRYYKVVIPATVSQDAYDGSEIENTATQTVHYYNPRTHKVETPDKPTQKRVNNIPTAIQLIFGKTLNGRKLQADEFSFVLKDKETNKILEKAKNDADGKVTFKTINYSKADIGHTFNYIVEEEKGDKPGITYDDMKVNVTVQVIQPSSGDQLSTVISYATEGGDAFTADDTVFDNNVTPNFKPEKYVVSKEKFDLKGTKLLDDDAPNGKVEAENLNHHTLTRGQKFYYQVWLDTREFTAESNIQSVGITDDYDEAKLDIDESAIKVYDGETDVTDKFDISIKNGVIYATSKPSLTKPISATDATPVIDTTKFAFGRYYKFDIPATVKNIKDNDGVEFSNTANEIVHQYNPYNKQVTTPKKPTQTRENNVPVPLEFNYTKKLEGRELTAGEFSFLLKDQDGKVLQTVSNDKDGHIKFEQLLFSKADLGKTFTYTVEEVNDNKPGISYDAMKATVTVQVTKDGKILKTVVNHASAGGNATDANDKEFNNKVVPPEKPKFQPEKYVVNQEKFDITGDKLVDDDKELADKYADTNANPYVDKTDNNEKENLNTKTVKRGDKLVYQVWLDTTKFDANNKDYIQTVGITDNYDEKKLNVKQSDIKAYDGKTGKDVTAMFDIKVENGVITANLKDGFTKSLGDKDNTQIIDTTKFAFGRYYKFDIPAIVKDSKNEKGEFDVPSGSDIENTAGQTVHYYDPTVKKVVKTPEKPTEKRVVNISASVTFEFTKKLEGRDLKAGEFSFVLKDRKGKVIETVSNDADGKIKFSALEYKHGEEGIHFYTVEEVKGNDTTVTYDKMVAKVTVLVAKGGNVMTVTSKLPEDTEFNNIVTPPTPPTPVVPPVTPPTPPTPVVPPVTPPTPPTPVVPPVTPPTPPTPVVPPVTPPTPPTPVVPPVTPPTPPTPVVPPVTPPTSPEVSREQGLPKTGENKSVVAMAFGGLLAAAGLGLAGKRKKED